METLTIKELAPYLPYGLKVTKKIYHEHQRNFRKTRS